MKRTATLVMAALILLAGGAVYAASMPDFADRPSMGDYLTGGRSGLSLGYSPGSLSSIGLLDPSRLKVDHSVTLGVSTAGKQSLMQGLYQSRFQYRLSNPVTLSFLLGVQNLKGNNIPGFNTANSFYGGFALDYRPGKNFLLRVEMQQMPCGYYPCSAFEPYSTYSMFGDRYLNLNPGAEGNNNRRPESFQP